MNRCHVCNGEMEERTVELHRKRNGSHFYFEHVPARVCKECGHRTYSAKTLRWLDELMRSEAAATAHVDMPVFDLVGASE